MVAASSIGSFRLRRPARLGTAVTAPDALFPRLLLLLPLLACGRDCAVHTPPRKVSRTEHGVNNLEFNGGLGGRINTEQPGEAAFIIRRQRLEQIRSRYFAAPIGRVKNDGVKFHGALLSAVRCALGGDKLCRRLSASRAVSRRARETISEALPALLSLRFALKIFDERRKFIPPGAA